jgi:hypothetical protein
MRIVLMTGAALVLSAAAALAHPSGAVIANGGGRHADGALRLLGTVGQAAVGRSGGPANIVCHGFWCFGGSRVVSVDPPGGGPPAPDIPKELSFGPPMPSPSRGNVTFRLGLPSDAAVKLSVFDVAGRAMGDPAELHLAAGWHQLHWSAAHGHAGIYFGVLEVNGAVQGRQRIVLVP